MSDIPEFLKQLLEEQYGKEITKKIIQGYCSKRNTTLRVNTLKSNTIEVERILKEHNIEYEKVQWSKEAIIIKDSREKEIKNLEIYQKGKIYLQSLSSMLPPLFLQPKKKADILDMAAAPGGKTTQIASLTNNEANITACEVNKIRAQRLSYNLQKQGANAYVMVQDATTIDDFFSFDQILLDAPCSGSGTIDVKDNKLQQMFTPKFLQKSQDLQKALLKKAINILKKGQEMVYSTCSILAYENEEVIKTVLKEKKAQIVPIKEKEIETLPQLPTKIKGTICICPDQNYEGFFIAKIKKQG